MQLLYVHQLKGRGTFTMVFDHYSPTPKSIQAEIIKKRGGEDAE